MKKASNRNALLEIGVEELPARFITPALNQLKILAEDEMKAVGLGFKSVQVFGTPRRLAVLIHGLAIKADDREDEAVGPPPKAAKDADGNWTKAATGFAKAQKISVDKLILKNTPKGERYVAIHAIRGQKTEAILKELFPTLVKKLNFPKSMIWSDPNFRFARPIRWFISLFNTKVIRFKLAGVTADRTTIGLLALGGQKIPVPKPERYKPLLQGRCILVDPEDRKKKILSQLESMAKKVKAKAVIPEDLLDEVVHLTEYPTSILGRFPESYLSLPREVLVSVLKKHQKFFPLETSKKNLTNAFVGVRNGPTDAHEAVRDGYERVLNARLADAKFFFDQDLQTSLKDLGSRLNEVGLHEKLGTLLDKSSRVQKLIEIIGRQLSLNSELIDKAKQAAFLAKADLLTQMVGEFPELQGIAGRFYSEHQKEDSDVAHAIEQHYWPLTADGKLPTSDLSALVSLADKIDTLAANFYVGHAPTGSADPYGLRRMSVGVIRILHDQSWPVSLNELIQQSYEFDLYKEQVPERKSELTDFFKNRLVNWFGTKGYRADEIEAVLSSGDQSLTEMDQKLKGLKAVRGKPEFASLAAAIKRARNILVQAKSKGILPDENHSVDGNALTDQAEKDLYAAIQGTSPAFNEAIKNKQYQEALLKLAPLKEPVDQFFDGVMVMVDDANLRSQRLGLLMSIESLFTSLADFSKLQATPSAQKN